MRRSFALRLGAAFAGVGIAAAALTAILVNVAFGSRFTGYLDAQQQVREQQLVAILADSYSRSSGWVSGDLSSLTPLAFMDGGTLRLLDASGRIVWGPSPDQLLGQMAEIHRQMMGGGVLGPEHRLPITVGGEVIGRIGVGVQPRTVVRDTQGVVGSVTGAVDLVGDNLVGTARGVARIFGPEGIGRLATLVFTDAPRRNEDPASVVGVGRVAGSLASEDQFGDLLFLFAIVNLFVGLLNLLPLPPFDGGHLAVLAIEKIRGRPVDMRKVIPVSAAVAAFFIVFTVAVVYVDLVKPPSV